MGGRGGHLQVPLVVLVGLTCFLELGLAIPSQHLAHKVPARQWKGLWSKLAQVSDGKVRAQAIATTVCFCGTDRHLASSGVGFDGAWVQCDTCSLWCHGECAGLSLQEAEQLEDYICPSCEQNELSAWLAAAAD